MLDAIRENRPEEQKVHLACLKYLQACSLLFENGTLSHIPIDNTSSLVLRNMKEGFDFFQK